jgi:hypothetical protein
MVWNISVDIGGKGVTEDDDDDDDNNNNNFQIHLFGRVW